MTFFNSNFAFFEKNHARRAQLWTKLDTRHESLCLWGIKNQNLICVRNIEGHCWELSGKFASQICHENINKALDDTYLADFGIDIRSL